jgi:hypothetical protein
VVSSNNPIFEKRCCICGTTKPCTEFPIKRANKTGNQRFDSRCKQCRSDIARTPEGRKRRRDYYRANADLIKRLVHESYVRHRAGRLTQKAEYRARNRDQIKQAKRAAYYADLHVSRERMRQSYARHEVQRRADRQRYYREDPEKVKESDARSRERRRQSGKAREANRRYFAANKTRLLAYEVDYRRRNVNRNISSRLRNRINGCLRYGRKSASTKKLVGCSFAERATHLQRQFMAPMSWVAFPRGEIHIDHIVPCSQFDLSLPEQQRQCFHYSNLQPLWATDNLRKSKRLRPLASNEGRDTIN